jgi:Zn-dependent metalloprotease
VGTAALAIGTALLGMTAVVLLLGALGVGSAPATLAAAAQDAAVAFYAVQLVGFSFFNETAELRFAAVPGLLLVGTSVVVVTAMAARKVGGTARRRMTVALATSIPYALLVGLAGLLVPLHFTAPGFGAGIAVSPAPVEAFLLPLGWGLLFASVGGLIGVFGRDWRHPLSRLLGAWSVPLATSLRALAIGLAASAALALAAGLAITGGDLGWLTGDGLGHAIGALGGALVALPTLAAAVLVSGFGVSFDWQLDALSHGEGSISAFGGALPNSGEGLGQAGGAPGVLALAPLVALAMVFAIGWLSARRAGPDARLSLANAARAAALTTLAVWVLALLARVDAQAGGLLGFHLAPDAGALLWRVPLVAFAGTLLGSVAWVLRQGPAARGELAATLRAAARPSAWRWDPDGARRLGRPRQGLAWRAAWGLGFLAVPMLAVGLGATDQATSAAPGKVSLAPIARESERVLEGASTDDEAVEVTVDPETRVLGTASVNTPLRALGIKPGESRPAKAEDVLDRYGELFGLPDPATELGNREASTDGLGVTHVSFTQMANGLPVFAGAIGVHLSRRGELLSFVSSSVVPNVIVADDEPELSRAQAIEVAKKALPTGSMVSPATLQVYAGLPPYTSGPNARLAWLVWLIGDANQASNEYVVDAVTGEILDTIPKAHEALWREVSDAEEESKLPGKLVRKEGDPETGDPDADAAYEFTGDVYNFYTGLAKRDSYDGNGATLASTVHFAQASGAPFENAYWNGERLVFGNLFPQAVDIVGHELTHAYTEKTSGLVGVGESGALNESISDIMGVAIENLKLEEENWEVGEELPTGAFRNIAEPGLYSELEGAGESNPDPGSLSEWVETCLDNFGIHINSTITSHAFYLAVTNLIGLIDPETEEEIGVEEATYLAAGLFYGGWMEFLVNPTASLEDARAATLAATKAAYPDIEGEPSAEYVAVEAAFEEVGLDGIAQPSMPNCAEKFECSFARALQGQGVHSASAASTLGTLYKARGELALPSAAGKYFLPLYEANMVRITELVSQDPVLAEMSVDGLAEITPALEGLMDGEGDQFELSEAEMAKIEAALNRLAEDDRLYGGAGAGELADLIEAELEWMGLPSYGGMDYESGWERLNEETESQMLMEETGVITDPNCNGKPYPNNFHLNGFYVDTPGHRIPGQVSPLNAGGIICGAEVEKTTGTTGCEGVESLNTEVAVQLPPGDKVNSSKNLANGSWVGEAIGYAIACAGDETRRIYGQAGLLSLSSWSEGQCPTAAIACFEGKTSFEGTPGNGYAWVSEEGGTLTMTMSPVIVEGPYEYQAIASFGQFEVKLCGRAGSAVSKSCGESTATWIHRNGVASATGCPEGKGRFVARGKNIMEETTAAVSSCVLWEKEAQMQTIGAPNSLTSVSCLPATTTCVATDSKGNLFYATNVNANAAATWNSWSGPGVSPSHDVSCPASTLCVLAAGEVGGGGGNVYRSSSLGGAFSTSFTPANGVGALSCPTTSFCVGAQEGGGFIRYSTKPSGTVWTAVAIGTGAMKDVACLSASFCAVGDAAGNIRVAVTEKGVKTAGGWTATNVNGSTALQAVSCSSTSSCLAVDGSNKVLSLAIAEGGAATASSQALAGAGALADVTCNGVNCVAVDAQGAIFASSNSGATWAKRFEARGNLTSVSCASAELCVAGTTAGDIATFRP